MLGCNTHTNTLNNIKLIQPYDARVCAKNARLFSMVCGMGTIERTSNAYKLISVE